MNEMMDSPSTYHLHLSWLARDDATFETVFLKDDTVAEKSAKLKARGFVMIGSKPCVKTGCKITDISRTYFLT